MLNKIVKTTLCLALSFIITAGANASTKEVQPAKAVPLEQLAIYPEVSAPATVESMSDSRISAELNAVIDSISVKVGDIVAAGSELASLDCSIYHLQVRELAARMASLNAKVEFARNQLSRAEVLEKKRILATELAEQRAAELAAYEAELEAQKAALLRAERDCNKCVVRAPFKAVVLERLASVGEYAVTGTPLLRLMDLEQLELAAAVLAADADSLQQAAEPVFRYQGNNYPLRLRALMPVIDPNSRTREARLEFSAEFPPSGASGRLVWQQPIALPADLLVHRNGGLGVMLAEQGRAKFHPLPQAQEGRPARVALPPWTFIITEGRLGLQDGDLINLVRVAE